MSANCLTKSVNLRLLAGAMLGALSFPTLAQDTSQPVDVTAAPPASSDTVGPAQLRNFSLDGQVTRPAEPVATPPARQPSATAAAPPATRRVPVRVPDTAAQPQVTQPRSEPAPVPVTRDAAPVEPVAQPLPQAGDSQPTPVPSPAPSASVDTPVPAPVTDQPQAPTRSAIPPMSDLMPWIAALVATLLGAGALWIMRGRRTSRRSDPGRLAFAAAKTQVDEPVADPAPEPVPAAPAPEPTAHPAVEVIRAAPTLPPAAPAPPKPSNDGFIISTSLKPRLEIEFIPDRLVVTDSEATIQFDVLITNAGGAAARDVLLEAIMVTAHQGQDSEIAEFYRNPAGKGDRIPAIPPMVQLPLKSAVRVPLTMVKSFTVEDRILFVPLVAFNLLYRSSAGEQQTSASYLVGRGDEGTSKLAPFRLDLGPRIFRGLSARHHSNGLAAA